jgi:dihydrofolate reductase
MNAIVAVDRKWSIGRDNKLLFNFSGDMKRFRTITTGGTVLMGRKTLESFPNSRPLPNRRNIVLTSHNIEIEGAEVVHTTEQALAAAKQHPRTLVLGGASVFRQFLPYLDTVHVTQIDACPQSDSYFENLDASDEWQLADEENWLDEDGLKYCFVTYKRK